jgi:hypothetical protein
MNTEMTDLNDTSDRPCTSFVPRTERDTEHCGACGWSRLGHERYAAELAREHTDRPGTMPVEPT